MLLRSICVVLFVIEVSLCVLVCYLGRSVLHNLLSRLVYLVLSAIVVSLYCLIIVLVSLCCIICCSGRFMLSNIAIYIHVPLNSASTFGTLKFRFVHNFIPIDK